MFVAARYCIPEGFVKEKKKRNLAVRLRCSQMGYPLIASVDLAGAGLTSVWS